MSDDPKLDWRKLLKFLRDSDEEVFYVQELAKKFGMKNGEMSTRLRRLRTWGHLKFMDEEEKIKGGYILTDRGKTVEVWSIEKTALEKLKKAKKEVKKLEGE